MEFWTTFFYVVVLVAVLIGAYLTTKFISGKSRKLLKSRHINVLDRLALGKDKNVVLIEVGDQTLLIGVTNQSINNLGQINGGSLKRAKEQDDGSTQKSFAQQLRDFIFNVKDAPGNLKQARTQAKKKQNGDFSDDILRQMDEAVQQRREHMGSSEDDKE